VIRSARQPDSLLFAELPAACGSPPFPADGTPRPDHVRAFFLALEGILQELQQAYPRLISDLEQLLIAAFHHSGSFKAVREDLAHQARLILNVAVDARLKSFLVRAADERCDYPSYLESIAALLAGKPPTVWDDEDRARFEVQLSATARTFHHFQALVFELDRCGVSLLNGDLRALRVSVTVSGGEELERVVRVPKERDDQARAAEAAVRRALAELGMLDDPQLSLAVLGQIVRGLLTSQARAVNDDLGSRRTTVEPERSSETQFEGR
jgi:hypothetical protein